MTQLYHPHQWPSPPRPEVEERKARFHALNRFVAERQGFLTSIPGQREVRMECLEDSSLPAELAALGYRPKEIEPGERILAHAVTEQFVRRRNGELAPLTPGSTEAVVEVRSHAGIVKVRRFTFTLP